MRSIPKSGSFLYNKNCIMEAKDLLILKKKFDEANVAFEKALKAGKEDNIKRAASTLAQARKEYEAADKQDTYSMVGRNNREWLERIEKQKTAYREHTGF